MKYTTINCFLTLLTANKRNRNDFIYFKLKKANTPLWSDGHPEFSFFVNKSLELSSVRTDLTIDLDGPASKTFSMLNSAFG